MADNRNNNGNRDSSRDLNEATIEDLSSLPFMSTERARLITDYIDKNGPLQSIEEVDNVPGIGEKLSELISQHFTVNEGRGGNRGGRGNQDNDRSLQASGRGGNNRGNQGNDDDRSSRSSSNRGNDDPDSVGERLSERGTSSADDGRGGRGGSRPADDDDGRHNNPGRPKGIPRDAEYSNDDRNEGRGGNGNGNGNDRSSR